MASKQGASLISRLAERWWYDVSLYKMYFKDKLDFNQYIALRHNLILVGGMYMLVTLPFPFKASFPTMGLCPRGYEGTFVCEDDPKKALQLYKDWKAGVKAPAAA